MTTSNQADRHGKTAHLTERQIDDLVRSAWFEVVTSTAFTEVCDSGVLKLFMENHTFKLMGKAADLSCVVGEKNHPVHELLAPPAMTDHSDQAVLSLLKRIQATGFAFL